MQVSTYTITIKSPDYTISENDDGTVKFLINGYSNSVTPGEPMVPCKTVQIELPRGACVRSLQLEESESEEIEGNYRVKPANASVKYRPGPPELIEELLEEAWYEQEQNYRAVYGSDNWYPESPVQFTDSGQGYRSSSARIRFFPFQYQPRSGRLLFMKSVRITIEYEFQAEHWDIDLEDDFDSFVKLPIVNQLLKNVQPLQPYDSTDVEGQFNFVIIVANTLLAAAVANFKLWKESIGHTVAVVYRDHIYRRYQGADRAEQIRSFLIEKLEEWKIRYVMLVGDLDEIPTRLLYGDPWTNKNGTVLQWPYAADFYYANLSTVDWDLDNDKRWGEFSADKFNYDHDVVVGRIPFNRAEDVKPICDNIVAFEQDTGSWKRNVLLPSGIMNTVPTDGAELAKRIIFDILQPQGWTARTLYEQGSVHSGHPVLNQTNFLNECQNQSFGLACLTAHGHPDHMVSIRPNATGGYDHNIFGNSNQITPGLLTSVVYLNGCSTACPVPNYLTADNSGLGSRFNLVRTQEHNGRRYLLNGAVAVIGSAATADVANGWNDPGDGLCWSLAYYFHRNLITSGKSVGDAFFDAAYEAANKHGLVRGVRVFYYLGDPTLMIEGLEIDQPG